MTASFTEDYIRSLLSSLEAQTGGCAARSIHISHEYSNLIAEAYLEDGRVLMIKSAPLPEMGARFLTSRAAAELIIETGVVAPRYLDLPESLPDNLLIYWRIPLLTLGSLWQGLSERARADGLRGCGGLIRRVHQVSLPGFGFLLEPKYMLSEFMQMEAERLLPCVEHYWSPARAALHRLSEASEEAEKRARRSVLVHNDVYNSNVLCRKVAERVECAGLLDWEDAAALPPESDLAKTELLHGPLFGRPLPDPWFDLVLEGYGAEPDAFLQAFFRLYHLLNMGVHAAMVGYQSHSVEVAAAADQEAKRLE